VQRVTGQCVRVRRGGSDDHLGPQRLDACISFAASILQLLAGSGSFWPARVLLPEWDRGLICFTVFRLPCSLCLIFFDSTDASVFRAYSGAVSVWVFIRANDVGCVGTGDEGEWLWGFHHRLAGLPMHSGKIRNGLWHWANSVLVRGGE